MTPHLFAPTPGLGYLTTTIMKLQVFTGENSYSIERRDAAASLAQTSQFHYEIRNGGSSSKGLLAATEWICLFDTGTFPAIFYADGSVNLLGTRVAQSMVKGQTTPSDFVTSSRVIYTFSADGESNYMRLSADNVQVPTVDVQDLIALPTLMTVCGFDFQSKYNICYKIDESIGLPRSVSFFS